jgi:hypothetical protein
MYQYIQRALVTVPYAPFMLQCSCNHYADIVAILLFTYAHAQPSRRSGNTVHRLFCNLPEVLWQKPFPVY